ncbi:MAG: DUF3387 domain-containing protein [Clostridia bacterium]|nr:DUF3387 domain-containing protein [Clostridia bacterium]
MTRYILINFNCLHYPPGQAKEALNMVMKQVELMCSNKASTYDGMLDLPMVAEEKADYEAGME